MISSATGRVDVHGAPMDEIAATGLRKLQDLIAKVLTGLVILHAPILAGLAALLGRSPLMLGALALGFAMPPILLAARRHAPRIVGLALAVALVSQTALLVDLFADQPWQVDMHFYFFAILAMLAGLCDPLVLIAAAAMIAGHHVVADLILPDALFSGGANIGRVAVHATIVIVETAMLVIIARIIRRTFDEAAAAEAKASHFAKAGTALKEELSTTTQRADLFEASLGAFRAEIADSLSKLVFASTSLDATADDFGTAFAQTTTKTQKAAATAETASQRVGEVAQAGRDYLDTMSAISSHASRSAGMGQSAVAEAKATALTIDELIQMSSRIDAATKLITGIANQTNLLALNATIEAARAGEHGRGFAVVAAEVKGLAAETTKALATITEMVGGIKTSTQRSVGAMSSIVASIQGLNGATATISDAVHERVALAAQIAANVDAAAADVERVAVAVEEIEGVARDSAKGAGLLRHAASAITEQTEAIRRHVASFAADLTVLALADDRGARAGG